MSDNPTNEERPEQENPGISNPNNPTNIPVTETAGTFDFPGMGPNPQGSGPTPPTQNSTEMESLLKPNDGPPSGTHTNPTQPPGGTQPQNPQGQNIGTMPNPIQGMGPGQKMPPTSTKSHLAEILGVHEMNQLQTMSRPLDNQNPMPPTQNPNRPSNPEMMGMRPGMPNMGGGFNPNMGYQHMFPGMPPGGQGMPPGHFRYPTPRNQTDFRQNPGFNPGAPHAPQATTPPMGKEEDSKKGGRKRRPSSRKNSRDGDETPGDGTGRKRKRGTKDDTAGGTKSTRKRKTKGAANPVPEGSLLLFSTQMLNEASQEVLKKKKNSTMVDYHQGNYGTSAQPLRTKMSTTPPIPSGMSGANLPGARPSLQQNNNHRQTSPAVMAQSIDQMGLSHPNMGAMSPVPHVMSPHNRPGIPPGRVPTPHDGRMTPGSIHSGVGRVPTPGTVPTGPQSPAQSQDSRIPTPLSPATSQPPCPSPGSHSQLSMDQQEGKLRDIRDISKQVKPNTSPNQVRRASPHSNVPLHHMLQITGRSPSQGGTPSPGPNQGANPIQMGANHPNQQSDQQQMINSIKMQQHQQRQYAMMHQQRFPPHHHPNYPPHMMTQGMHPGMRNHYAHMRHRYPMDPSGRFPMHPGMHPRMQFPPHMMNPNLRPNPMGAMRSQFPGDSSMGNPNMGPGGPTNYYSEQLRQKAMANAAMGPNGQNPGMNPQMVNGPGPSGPSMGPGGPGGLGPGGPGGMGPTGPGGMGQNGPNFNPGFPGNDNMMNQNGNFNNQNSNGSLQNHNLRPSNPGGPGSNQGINQSSGGDPFNNQPHTPNSGPNGYPGPSNSPSASQFNQNGPGLMSPMSTPTQNNNTQSTGQNPSSLVNLLHSNSDQNQSPYQNQAKSPASQLNGNIMSPTPSQPPGGPPSIAPSVPEFAPTTPSGPPPLSPAHTNPMTPVSHMAPNTPSGQNDSFGPMTPSGGAPNQAPMTPLTNPMTPSNPVTPGPATPSAPVQPPGPDSSNQNIDIQGGGSMSLPPCSPHTPQFQQRPDAPLTPGGGGPGGNLTPNGAQMNPKMNGDLSLPPDTMDMAFLNNPRGQDMHPAMNMNYSQPRMSHPGLHHMGMNQASRFPGMHQNMIPSHGMGSNPNMSAYGHPQQWAAYGPGNGPRGY